VNSCYIACSIPQIVDLIIGAALLVVQLAFEIMVSLPSKMPSLLCFFMLSTSDGAERITFLAPAVMRI
jgi:hypothetical protein